MWDCTSKGLDCLLKHNFKFIIHHGPNNHSMQCSRTNDSIIAIYVNAGRFGCDILIY